ncbi:hypothetical protein [Streptomyces sp. NPDC050504]|uniref:hypothetical protein n=1 Tax=Streptomyces sp. NPDC050504 TaxID=3365618 RepID=UPI00378A0E59
MSTIGPVEPEPPGRDFRVRAPGPVDVIGPDPPRVSDRWRELPPRRRLLAKAVAAVAAAAALLVLLRPSPSGSGERPPAPPPRPLSPWPAQSTALDYEGPGPARPPSPANQSADFRFTVAVRYGEPVTVEALRHGLPGLSAVTTPAPPLRVSPGRSLRIVVRTSVDQCTEMPREIDYPHLEMTLRNSRIRQQHSFLFGGAYPRDLARLLRAACGGPTVESPPASP